MRLTDDEIEEKFFGCGIVAESEKTAEVLKYMFENGYRHHVAIAKGNVAGAVKEAMEKYLGYKAELI